MAAAAVATVSADTKSVEAPSLWERWAAGADGGGIDGSTAMGGVTGSNLSRLLRRPRTAWT